MNTFSMKKQWVQNAPTVVYSLIVGGLSDDFGRKPLIYVPLFGSLLSAIIQLLICIFIEQLPVEAFYADTIYAYCGGMPVYYMGVYSYGSSVTTPEERPHRLGISVSF